MKEKKSFKGSFKDFVCATFYLIGIVVFATIPFLLNALKYVAPLALAAAVVYFTWTGLNRLASPDVSPEPSAAVQTENAP
ncbi:MAG: hypothetical protein IJ387_00030 [Thermoguttaceae bacterium]|nr:hypothetical protein [Thermoguttaceae bacterium]